MFAYLYRETCVLIDREGPGCPHRYINRGETEPLRVICALRLGLRAGWTGGRLCAMPNHSTHFGRRFDITQGRRAVFACIGRSVLGRSRTAGRFFGCASWWIRRAHNAICGTTAGTRRRPPKIGLRRGLAGPLGDPGRGLRRRKPAARCGDVGNLSLPGCVLVFDMDYAHDYACRFGRSVNACEGVDSNLVPIVTSHSIVEGLMKQSMVKEATIYLRRLR